MVEYVIDRNHPEKAVRRLGHGQGDHVISRQALGHLAVVGRDRLPFLVQAAPERFARRLAQETLNADHPYVATGRSLERRPAHEHLRGQRHRQVGLDQERLARVLDEMEADDAADLLAEFSATRQAELLGAMDPEEAEPVRRLLVYQPDTAGGLITPNR